MTKITNVPNTADNILSVINLRGQIVPVIDLKEKLGLKIDKNSDGENKRIVIVNFNDLLLGLLVDGVREVIRIRDENIEDKSDTKKGMNQEYIKGISQFDDSLIIIINLENILNIKNDEDKR